jgi:DNA-binding beta-propeller fold protein YncE
MNKGFTVLIIAGLATILVPLSARAGGMAFDGAGKLFETGSHSIFKFTPDGKKSAFATGIKDPVDLTFDGKGNLFVSDGGSHSILKFTPNGKKSTFASGLSAYVGSVYYLAFDAKGNLFVLDQNTHSIFKFTPDGKKSTFASGLTLPHDLAIDRSGNLFVADSDGTILKFTPDGTKSTFASGLSRPWDMAVDGAGNLFVVDNENHSILKFSADGTQSTFATGLDPIEVAFDPLGNLFASDGDRNTIFKFAPDGAKSTFVTDRVSPDKQWEYQQPVGKSPGILKAGTTQVVLDLSNGKVVWAPDSKRFGFNYRAGTRDYTTALYQLRDDKWVQLRDPEDETMKPLERAMAAGLARMHLEKKPARNYGNTLEVRKWTDANTAIVHAHSDMMVIETYISADFLFTLKFDEAGNWKIVKTHEMSKKEMEEE